MQRTHWFGEDRYNMHAITMEGTCIRDIRETEGRQFYNQATGQRGDVYRGEDGELHFRSSGSAAENRMILL